MDLLYRILSGHKHNKRCNPFAPQLSMDCYYMDVLHGILSCHKHNKRYNPFAP